MDRRRWQGWVGLSLMALAALQTWWYYPRLPARVISHLDAAGRPDGYTAKGVLFIEYWILLLMIAGFFLLAVRLIPKTPVKWISLPHKDYWMSPQRRGRAFAFMIASTAWFGNATLLFFIFLFQILFSLGLGNLDHPGRWIWTATGAYVALTIWWTVHFVRFYYRTDS
jgi:uncharacterized membrane protein